MIRLLALFVGAMLALVVLAITGCAHVEATLACSETQLAQVAPSLAICLATMPAHTDEDHVAETFASAAACFSQSVIAYGPTLYACAQKTAAAAPTPVPTPPVAAPK